MSQTSEDDDEENINFQSSDEEDAIQLITLDCDMDSIAERIETKYSSQTIQNFIEKLYYFNSLKLVGEWNLFGIVFKEMETEDCKGYFAHLKLNGFLDDVKLRSSFTSEKQLKNVKLILDLHSKASFQFSKILPPNDDIIEIQNDGQYSILSDDDDQITFNPVSEENNAEELFEDQNNYQEKTNKVVKMPQNKYFHYKDYKIVVDKALRYIDQNKKVSFISKELNIPYSTVRGWKKRYKHDPLYRPYKRKRRNKYFTKEEDDILFDKVKNQMTKQRFNYLSFLKILNENFLKSIFHIQNLTVVPKFNAQWIPNWRTSHKISLRKYHFRRRTLNDPLKSINYRDDVFNAIMRYGSKNVYNMDETSWGLVPHDDKVWAVTGSDEVIFDVSKNYPNKARFTAIATINANGDKMPLITVAKGKTVRCEKAFKNILGHVVTHTTNGWSTESLMIAYLQWLSQISNGASICLVWDQFRAHCTQKVEDFAENLHIEIIKVPEGQTGTEQPLDRLIFGSMKKTADKIWNQKLMNNEKNLYTRETACQIMIDSWKSIKEKTIKKSWNHIYNKNHEEINEIDNDHDWYVEEEEENSI